jgi:hypothetical protein
VGFAVPPTTYTREGKPRRVGIELEFAGLDVPEAADLVQRLFGGKIEEQSRFRAEVKGTPLGDFRVEIDSNLLKKDKHRELLEKVGAKHQTVESVEGAIEAIAKRFIPTEIATPPLPMDALDEADRLREALCLENALGTRASVLYAFGLHLNPELPDLEVGTFLDLTRAFFLLYDWLVGASKIDLSRRIAPFIEAFPDEYCELVLDLRYTPNMKRFMRDYFAMNPTRNRPLDLAPALAVVDKDYVLAHVKEHDQVKARPALHYRLPNCCVDDPSWTIAEEWNRWVEIERLAADPRRIEALATALREAHA